MDKKNEILHAAYYLFAEKGYALSMSEIAEAVNIKTPSLYSHFKSKDEIIELIIRDQIEHCFDTIEKSTLKLKDKNCEEKLKSILFYVIDYYKKNSRLNFWRHISLLHNKKLKNISKTLIQERDSYISEHIKNCFAAGIKNKEIKDNVSEGQMYLYFSMIQGILNATFYVQKDEITIDDFASLAWEAYWTGIKV
ncbi:TetR/AcrR family transcriptional regulator [Aminipila terrae]|uniref:TetR family transcriptional regulator n=1 Tax=Aminipila terrae TaxID=2697030 RepID=A0A6P1MIV0_9FIRM|nr:TetR/AcrR family transcriptional regulator [Aminipila terrae]QHI73837.1 TetR family transcriptional regulator [Aminipila terrae]